MTKSNRQVRQIIAELNQLNTAQGRYRRAERWRELIEQLLDDCNEPPLYLLIDHTFYVVNTNTVQRFDPDRVILEGK